MCRTALDPRLPRRTPSIDPRLLCLQAKVKCPLAVTQNVPRKSHHGWTAASLRLPHNPRESKKQALWLRQSTCAKSLRKNSSPPVVILPVREISITWSPTRCCPFARQLCGSRRPGPPLNSLLNAWGRAVTMEHALKRSSKGHFIVAIKVLTLRHQGRRRMIVHRILHQPSSI